MKMRLPLLVVLGLAACQGKSKPAATGSAPVAGSASGATPAQPPDEPARGSGKTGPHVVKLPDEETTPIPKSRAKITKATLDKLAALDWPSFNRIVRIQTGNTIEVAYNTRKRPHLETIVYVGPCFDCLAMDLAKWQAHTDALKVYLQPALRDHPDTQFEVGATELHGAPIIYTFQFGWAQGKDPDSGQPVFSYSNQYTAYYNDGVNQIRVLTRYADDLLRSRDELLNIAPKQDLEKITKRFLDAFVHRWQ